MQIINRNTKDYAPIKFDMVISNENRNNFTINKHEENLSNSIHLKGCLLPEITEVHTPTNGVIQITRDTRILIDIMQNSARISNYEKEYLVVFAFKLIDFMYMETNQRLPDKEFKIAHRWSGIMGIGNSKNPIVTQLSENVYCGVRLGGMGVAIGSLIGKELAELV